MSDPAAFDRLVVNGIERRLGPGPDRSLLAVLRDELALTAAKPGCGEGACGSCTVLLDGTPVRACQVRLSELAGLPVRTLEGLVPDGTLHPVQQAFLEMGAFQCGYCTPGMIMSTVALLEREPGAGEGRIREALHGNICRCGTYPRIIRAVRRAAEMMAPGEGTAASVPAVPDPRWSDALRPRRPWDLTPAAERDWFDVLPDGLVAVHEPAPSAGSWTTSAGAWVHIGPDGVATAFTGKVEVGQDNRTSLSLSVAEELRLPVDRIRLVMGDTDLCPHDAGTFGSRSTPDAAPLLRRAAAGARGSLVGLAAERWAADPHALVAEGGVVRSAGGDIATYAELVEGLRLVEPVDAEAPVPGGVATFQVPLARDAATARPSPSARRASGSAVVTGTKRYPSDLSLSGMLHGRVLRPPAAGATLRSADTSAAAAMPGVTVVRDGAFVGVVAPSPSLAGGALRSIHAEWDLPEAPSDARLAAWLRDHPAADERDGWGGAFHQGSGDVETALAAAPTRLETTYTTAFIAHVPLETHTALATWEGDRLTVWTGTQVPFGVREQVAGALGMPEVRVRVIVPDTGGGFGGKHAGGIAVEAARLARGVGRPVKVRWSRPEEFTAGYLRPAAVIDIASGASGDGISAWIMRNTNSGMFGLVGPYDVPNQRLDFVPAESPLPQGSYRALAATANHFARESHMDELAAALGVDPLELRLAHLRDARLADVLRAAAERIGWARSRGGGGLSGAVEPGHGLGIAGGIEKGARVATAVEVRVGEDRRLEVLRVVTAFDCGAVVDRDGLENQVEGALVMGLGGALFEAVRADGGVIANASMTDYRVPRIDDVPSIEVILLDRADVPSAGAGETPIIAIAPALANAIFAATGVRLRSMPLVPDGVVPGITGAG